MTHESKFKAQVKKIISEMFPGCYMHEMKAGAQGIPDTLIIFKERWALLEFKESAKAKHRPNQDYYVEHFNDIGFARFIYPENMDEVLDDLKRYFI